MPSPIRRYRPTGFAYPHRKLSRPWLIKIQEELWKDGPSGDGPEEDGHSRLISLASSREKIESKTDYKIHSPSAEDLISHETDPFPTIIDTMIEESSSFPEEFVSRTSFLYEGPSSLLNSFIFRPNLPYSSLSSIKTPVIEESSDFRNVIPLWNEESVDSRIMSPRQALSETVFNEFLVVTAISATNIEIEASQTSFTNISLSKLSYTLHSNLLEGSLMIPRRYSSDETFTPYPEQSLFYTENTVLLTSYELTDSISLNNIRPTTASQMFLGLNTETSFLKNQFHSTVLTEMPDILTYGHFHVFYKTSELSSHLFSQNIESYFDQAHTLSNLFSNDILTNSEEIFYTKMPFKSLLFSNVQTILKVVESENKRDIFSTPVSKEHQISATHNLFSSDAQNADFSLKNTNFENVFSYISASFSDLNEIVPAVSILPIDKSLENDINTLFRLDATSILPSITHTIISEFISSKQLFSETLSPTKLQSYSKHLILTPITTAVPDVLSLNGENNVETETHSQFFTEVTDMSTHHVTVRSLNENSFIDIIESVLQDTSTSTKDILPNFPSKTSTNVFTLLPASVKETKSKETVLSDNSFKHTSWLDEALKTAQPTVDYFPVTKTTVPEYSSSFENSLHFDNPEIYPSLNSLYVMNTFTKITSAKVYGSHTSEELNDEIYKEINKSSLNDSDIETDPTETRSSLHVYPSIKTASILIDETSKNKYMENFISTSNGQNIKLSLISSHFSDMAEPEASIDVYKTLDLSDIQDKLSESYFIQSSLAYLSEHLFHSFTRIITDDLSAGKSYSDVEPRTRTIIPLKLSVETDSTRTSDFMNFISDQNSVVLKSQNIETSLPLNLYSVSKIVASEKDSEIVDFGYTKSIKTSISYEDNSSPSFPFKTLSSDSYLRFDSIKTDFTYDFYSDLLTLNSVHYCSTLDKAFDTNEISSTSSFLSFGTTEFSNQISDTYSFKSPDIERQDTPLVYVTHILTPHPSDSSKIESDITSALKSEEEFYFIPTKTDTLVNTLKTSSIYDIYSETISKAFEIPFRTISNYFSEEDINIYQSVQETPIKSDTASQDSTLTSKMILNIPSRYIESSIDYGQTLAFDEKSEFYLHTPEFTFLSRVPSGEEMKFSETSSPFIDSFTLIENSVSDDEIPQMYSSKEILYEKSVPVSDLELESKLIPTKIISRFSSETISKVSSVLIMPTKSLKFEENIPVSSADDKLHSNIDSHNFANSVNLRSSLVLEQNTIFYERTSELTPSLLTAVPERTACKFPSCFSDTKILISSSYTSTLPLQNSYQSELISPILFPNLDSKTDISAISLQKSGFSFPWFSTTNVRPVDSRSITKDKSIKSILRSIISHDTPSQIVEYSSSKLDLKLMEVDYSIKTTPAKPFGLTTSVNHQQTSRVKTKSVGIMISPSTFGEKETLIPSEEISTPGYDIEMASVLAISSFIGSNSSRNTSSGFENSGILENDWSKSEVKPTPPLDLNLFRDNNYWILTVLETPVKGHLPENFSHTLEVRLANAYSEAFRQKYPKQGGSSEPIIVKILSLTNDLLLSQLNIVYVVEKGGILLPADIASELFNFLRHEQLREFLGLYAILKAKPYRPDEMPETKAISSTIPVVTIVCSILGFLLLLFCCFCVYCRCCRPKQTNDASPTSSASGSLQRSLAKHGQHNRKHLFQEMAQHLTSEIVAAHRKTESPAKELYYPEKEPPFPGKKLPPLPTTEQEEAIDKAARMLKMLENKDASTSPIIQKRSRGKSEPLPDEASTLECKKSLTKSKKRKKAKEMAEAKSTKAAQISENRDSRLPSHIPEKVKYVSATDESRTSPDSGTSSRHTSSSPASAPEKNEETGSDGSNTELLPPVQDLIAKSKAESAAAVADTQDHLSRVRQRISEILDDAFALANGRKFYGSMRSKKIDPATEMFPRYGSVRSQSAAECSLTRHEEISEDENRRPISEGAQTLLGALTDDGQLITRPPPKLVWDNTEFQDSVSDKAKHSEVTEAHNRHVNFFPFQQQSELQQLPSTSTALHTLHTSDTQSKPLADGTSSSQSTINVLRGVTSEMYPAHSSKIHPAASDQYYNEIDLVKALKEEEEPVIELIQAIKEELQKFNGSISGTHNNESNA